MSHLFSHMLRQTATYYYTHAGHRRAAIELAIEIVEQTAAKETAGAGEDPFRAEASALMGEWVLESLLQGAYLREYHAWEKDTKQYFDDQLIWNSRQPLKWQREVGDHVVKVSRVLATLSAQMSPDVMSQIDAMRVKVNAAKHDEWSDDQIIQRGEWHRGVAAIERFWEMLADQERFSPHIAEPR